MVKRPDTFCVSKQALLAAFKEVRVHGGSTAAILQALHAQLETARDLEETLANSVNKRTVKLHRMNKEELELQGLNFTGRKKGRQPRSHRLSDSLVLLDRKQRGYVRWVASHIADILDAVDEVGANVLQTTFDTND